MHGTLCPIGESSAGEGLSSSTYKIQWMAAVVQLHNAMHSGRQTSSCQCYISRSNRQVSSANTNLDV